LAQLNDIPAEIEQLDFPCGGNWSNEAVEIDDVKIARFAIST
jgi:hypothetical protein